MGLPSELFLSSTGQHWSIRPNQPIACRFGIIAQEEFFGTLAQLVGGQIAISVAVEPTKRLGGFGVSSY